MKKITDKEIRALAKQAGWWSTYEGWWEQEIPRLRKFLELVREEEAKCNQISLGK